MQVHRGCTGTSDVQQPVVASVYPSLEHWSSTSFQSLPSHEILSISSLVPSTVLTLIPHYKPAVSGNLNPEPPFFPILAPELQLPGTSASPSGSSQARDQTTLVFPPSAGDNLQGVQHREPSDGGPLEEGSIGLMFPKDVPEGEPGMDSRQSQKSDPM